MPYTIEMITQSDDPDYGSKTKELSAVNKDAPTIQWVLPENHDPYYETSSPDPILLGVEPVSDEPISKVVFYRWDGDLGMIVRIGEDDNPPYQFYLNPQTLDYQLEPDLRLCNRRRWRSDSIQTRAALDLPDNPAFPAIDPQEVTRNRDIWK